MRAQMRPFRQPAPHAEVRMIALREHPAVAAGNDAELHPGRPAYGVLSSALQRNVSLERDSADDALAEPGRPCDDTVGSIRTDEEARADDVRADACGHAGVTELDVAHGDSVAELCAGSRRLLDEMEVEPPALRHLDERLRALPSQLPRYPTRMTMVSTTCSTTASTAQGSCLNARPVSPPPHGLSRGNRALSTRRTRIPARWRWIAVADPAGPAPTTRTSKRSIPRS